MLLVGKADWRRELKAATAAFNQSLLQQIQTLFMNMHRGVYEKLLYNKFDYLKLKLRRRLVYSDLELREMIEIMDVLILLE